MSLKAPPKRESPSRAVGRILFLLVLLVGAGAAIYTAVTNQRIDLTEDRREAGIELGDPIVVDGVRLNVVEDEGGGTPVVILHDVDVTGGLTLADLSASLPDGYRGVRIDLPGFGYSERIPEVNHIHTIAGTADLIAVVIEQRFGEPVLLLGVGYGGEVAADIAIAYPNLVSGLVMVDTDFWLAPSLEVSIQRLPWVGRAATYTWETGGRSALDNWSPDCDMGGWCPTQAQLAQRAGIVEIVNTTDSLWSFHRTPDAAVAPANMAEINVPTAYVWSVDGPVSQSTVDRTVEEMTAVQVFESNSFAAYLEDFPVISSALAAVSSGQ